MRMVLLLALLGIAACRPGDPLKPEVVVTPVGLHEYDDGFSKTCYIVLKLENTSPIPVYSTTVSIVLITDKDTYYRTIYDDNGIPPSTAVFTTVEMAYRTQDEEAELSGVSVGDSFFD